MNDIHYCTFEPRRVATLSSMQLSGTTFKRYCVTYGERPHDSACFDEARALVEAAIPAPDVDGGRAGAGFVIEHQGATGDYLVVCWWDRQNELPIRVWVREGAGWRPAGPSESVCVWDLEIIWFERQAWVATVLSGMDVETGRPAYLARHFEPPTGLLSTATSG